MFLFLLAVIGGSLTSSPNPMSGYMRTSTVKGRRAGLPVFHTMSVNLGTVAVSRRSPISISLVGYNAGSLYNCSSSSDEIELSSDCVVTESETEGEFEVFQKDGSISITVGKLMHYHMVWVQTWISPVSPPPTSFHTVPPPPSQIPHSIPSSKKRSISF